MQQEAATQLYTGGHWKVEAAVLSEVEHFTRFAVSRSLVALEADALALALDQHSRHLGIGLCNPAAGTSGGSSGPTNHRTLVVELLCPGTSVTPCSNPAILLLA